MTLVKRFISHYMFVEPISKDENFCRWFAEEMRSNKGVWITEYFAVSNEKKSELLHIASEIKRLSLPVTVRVLDVFSEDNSFFIVTEIPKSKLLVPMDRFDTDRFRLIGGNLLKAFVILQRNGIGIEEFSLSDIFVDENRDIQLMITKGWVIKSAKESRENEIILFAVVLLNYLGFKDDEKVEITRESLKEFVPEKIYPLFEEILITRQVQRFESLSRYFQEKMKVTVDSIMDTDETEHSISNRMMGYIMLGIAAAIMYVTLSSNNDITHSTQFDVWRYQVLANIGVSESQRILGELYEKGYGVDKDMRLSVEWYRKAAQSGNVYAQMSLGHFYDQGIGVLIDRKQALYWFTLAATNGDELAKKNIEVMQDNEKKSELPVNEVKQKSKNLFIPLIENNVSKDIDIKIEATPKSEPANIKTEPLPNIKTEPLREEKMTTRNGIMWQDNEDTVIRKLTWNEAMRYCLDLKLDGYDDWRLPDKEILFQLFFEEQDLKYHSEDLYWSSTQDTDLTAWRVYFNYIGGKNRLSLTSNSKNDRWNVRCYRKIQ